MWAHYSDKHKGLCHGFEIPKERARRVIYIAKRIPFVLDASAREER
jgi:hypothetical protein